MFEAFKSRIFIAKVMAEIKAQHADLEFIVRLFENTKNIEHLSVIKDQAYYRKDKVAPFIHACHILGESMDNPEFSEEDRKICASLLAQRLEKVSSNPAFRFQHIMIFGALEEKVLDWGRANDFA